VGVDRDETNQFARGLQAIAKSSRRTTTSSGVGSPSQTRLSPAASLASGGTKVSQASDTRPIVRREGPVLVGRGGGIQSSESWWTLGGRLLALRYLYSSGAAIGPHFPLGSLVEVSYAHSLQVFWLRSLVRITFTKFISILFSLLAHNQHEVSLSLNLSPFLI